MDRWYLCFAKYNFFSYLTLKLSASEYHAFPIYIRWITVSGKQVIHPTAYANICLLTVRYMSCDILRPVILVVLWRVCFLEVSCVRQIY